MLRAQWYVNRSVLPHITSLRVYRNRNLVTVVVYSFRQDGSHVIMGLIKNPTGWVFLPRWLQQGWGEIPLNVAVEAIGELEGCPDWFRELAAQVQVWGDDK